MSFSSVTLAPPCDVALVLEDGKRLEGLSFGAKGKVLGEICFQTAMTGYQEILTDPSYNGQIIIFTFPHIGNTGGNREDMETTASYHARGMVVRDSVTPPSSWRATFSLQQWLQQRKIVGISGIDTRFLTRLIRTQGAQRAAICSVEEKAESVREEIRAYPLMQGRELAAESGTKVPYAYGDSGAPFYVAVVDYGVKKQILDCLSSMGCYMTVVPAGMSAREITALRREEGGLHGILLSNGPGDPAATGRYATAILRGLLETALPIFGICMGHQLLAMALGCETYKMSFGHRGANQPVKELETGRCFITSQNHGFVVREETLPSQVEVTYRSLFDKCIEGIKVRGRPVFSVQFHPEASPGPQDCRYLFEQFLAFMESYKNHA